MLDVAVHMFDTQVVLFAVLGTAGAAAKLSYATRAVQVVTALYVPVCCC